MSEKSNSNSRYHYTTNNSTSDNDYFEELDRFIRNLDISIANLEKLAVSLIIIGYSYFLIGANIDILEAKDMNENKISPDTITLEGQYFITYGYFTAWIVAVKRVYEKSFRNSTGYLFFPIEPYQIVAQSYLLSVIANSLRLYGFYQIERDIQLGFNAGFPEE